jgi:hypothetical protein
MKFLQERSEINLKNVGLKNNRTSLLDNHGSLAMQRTILMIMRHWPGGEQ